MQKQQAVLSAQALACQRRYRHDNPCRILIAEDSNGQGTNLVKNIIAISVGAVIMVSGYFVFQAFILGEGLGAAFGAIPGNLTQILFGLASLIIIKYLPELKVNGK